MNHNQKKKISYRKWFITLRDMIINSDEKNLSIFL